MPSTILSDNGVSSGTAGIKTTGSNDGQLALQTTTAGGTATTALTIDTSQNVGIGTSSPNSYANYTTLTVNGTDADIDLSRSGTRQFALYTTSTLTALNNLANLPLYFYTNNTSRMILDTSGNLQFNSGYGSVATAYGCRAWVNFNGTGTVSIYGSGNVTSITDNGTGLYQVNFTNSLVDANYGVVITGGGQGASGSTYAVDAGSATTAKVNIRSRAVSGGAAVDENPFSVSVFR